MRLRYAAASDVGLIRSGNEDSFIARDDLFVVCDGMGGARAGEVASATACATIAALDPGSAGREDLHRVVFEANKAVIQKGAGDPQLQGMGTTMTAAFRTGPATLALAHVGDSRAYLLRDQALHQLTEDHSLVAELVRQGRLTPEQAAVHPHRSVITRALGIEPETVPDLFQLAVKPGDRLLLCSDGLSGMIDDEAIERILGEGDDPAAVTAALVDAALQNGGEDNVTVVAVLVEEGDGAEGMPSGAGAAEAGTPADEAGEASGWGARRPSLPGGERFRDAGRRLRGGAGTIAGSVTGAGGTSRPGRRTALIWAAAVSGLLLLAVVGFVVFNSSVYYVGTQDGRVALFNGVPYELFGLELYDVVEVTRAEYDAQADHLQERIDSHELVSKEEGQRFIRRLFVEEPAPDAQTEPTAGSNGVGGAASTTTFGGAGAETPATSTTQN